MTSIMVEAFSFAKVFLGYSGWNIHVLCDAEAGCEVGHGSVSMMISDILIDANG